MPKPSILLLARGSMAEHPAVNRTVGGSSPSVSARPRRGHIEPESRKVSLYQQPGAASVNIYQSLRGRGKVEREILRSDKVLIPTSAQHADE